MKEPIDSLNIGWPLYLIRIILKDEIILQRIWSMVAYTKINSNPNVCKIFWKIYFRCIRNICTWHYTCNSEALFSLSSQQFLSLVIKWTRKTQDRQLPNSPLNQSCSIAVSDSLKLMWHRLWQALVKKRNFKIKQYLFTFYFFIYWHSFYSEQALNRRKELQQKANFFLIVSLSPNHVSVSFRDSRVGTL